MASSTDPPLMLSRRTSGLNFCRWLGCSLPWAPAPHRSPHHHGACRSCAPCSSTHTRRADRVGSRRCAQTRSCPGRRVCRLPAGRRRPHAVQPRRRRRIVHRGAADRGTGVRAGPDALLRPRRRAPADRPKPAGHPLGRHPRRCHAPRSWRPVDRLGGCRCRLRLCPHAHRSRRVPLHGWRCAAPGGPVGFGNRSVRSGSVPLGGRCLGTGRPVALVVLLSRPVNGWGAVGLSPDLLNRSDQFVLPHTRCSLHAGSISQRTQFGQHHGGQRAGRLVGVEVWGSVAAASDGLPSVLSPAVMRSVSVTDFLSFPR